MLTLRLTQTPLGEDHYQIALELTGDDQPRQTATAQVSCTLDAEQMERLRWYLEDYLQFPYDPAPTLAAEVERQIEAIGRDQFQQLFEANPNTLRL